MTTPLLSVRQALNSIFEECRLKTDAINKMIKQAISNKRKAANTNRKIITNKNRREIWYKLSTATPHSSRSVYSTSESESSSESDSDEANEAVSTGDVETGEATSLMMTNEKKLSTVELTKRFMLNYLNSIGKLFTKVGMESYPDVCSQMLHELEELLRRRPCPLGKMRLLQINAINIAVIDLIWKQSQDQQPQSLDDSSGFIMRSQQLECAIQLSLDIFALLGKRFEIVNFQIEL